MWFFKHYVYCLSFWCAIVVFFLLLSFLIFLILFCCLFDTFPFLLFFPFIPKLFSVRYYKKSSSFHKNELLLFIFFMPSSPSQWLVSLLLIMYRLILLFPLVLHIYLTYLLSIFHLEQLLYSLYLTMLMWNLSRFLCL